MNASEPIMNDSQNSKNDATTTTSSQNGLRASARTSNGLSKLSAMREALALADEMAGETRMIRRMIEDGQSA